MNEILFPIGVFVIGYLVGQAFPLHWVLNRIGGKR